MKIETEQADCLESTKYALDKLTHHILMEGTASAPVFVWPEILRAFSVCPLNFIEIIQDFWVNTVCPIN